MKTYPTSVSTKLLVPRANLRLEFDGAEIARLAESQKAIGIQQPILARPHPAKAAHYEIVDGERRWRAAILAGMETVPVTIREMDDHAAMVSHAVMFFQRVDLTPMEEAEGFRKMLARGLTVAELATELQIDPMRIQRAMRMLQAPQEIRLAVLEGRMTARVAAMIGAIPGDGARAAAARELLAFNAPGGNPLGEKTAATDEQAREYIAKKVYRDLRRSPFDKGEIYSRQDAKTQREEKLPKCEICPQRTGNIPEAMAAGSPEYLCTNPECFGAKGEAAWMLKARKEQRSRGAKEQRILSHADSLEIFPEGFGAGHMSYVGAAEWADLAGKPREVSANILPEKVPTWKEILSGVMTAPKGNKEKELRLNLEASLTLARAQDGSVRELVPYRAALEAAKSMAGSAYLFERRKVLPAAAKGDGYWDEEKAQGQRGIGAEGQSEEQSTKGHEEDKSRKGAEAQRGKDEEPTGAAVGDFSPAFVRARDGVMAAIRKSGPSGVCWIRLAEYFALGEGLEPNDAAAAMVGHLAEMLEAESSDADADAQGLSLLRDIAPAYGINWEKEVARSVEEAGI